MPINIITLHIPILKDTRHIINRKAIQLMRPGVILINTSRGGLVNTKDVIDGLKTKHVGSLGWMYMKRKPIFFFGIIQRGVTG